MTDDTAPSKGSTLNSPIKGALNGKLLPTAMDSSSSASVDIEEQVSKFRVPQSCKLPDPPSPTPPAFISPELDDGSPQVPNEGCQHESHQNLPHNPHWHPFWLGPTVLGAFGILFMLIAVVLVFLTVYSKLNDGLTTAHDDAAYIWRFGPTACTRSLSKPHSHPRLEADCGDSVVFTLIAVLWARTELQALRYTPWLTLQEDSVSIQDYDLDYTGMWLPMILVRSVKSRHVLVAVATMTTLVLRIQIALSSSIFQSVFVRSIEDTNIKILSSFEPDADIPDPMLSIEPNAYVKAIQQYGLDLPFGVSTECAYQTFAALSSDGDITTATPDHPITAVVDGLFADIQCLLLNSCTLYVDEESWVRLNLTFDECGEAVVQETVFQLGPERGEEQPELAYGYLGHLNVLDRRPCHSLPQENPQLMYLDVEIDANYSWAQLNHCSATLCSSRAWISKVKVIDNGVTRQISPASIEGEARHDAFDMDPLELLTDSQTLVDLDLFWTADDDDSAVGVQSHQLAERLQGAVSNFTTMVAHQRLRVSSGTAGFGTRTRDVAKMQANMGVCFSMAAISCGCAVSALLALRHFRKARIYYYRDPATVLGTIVHLHHGCGRRERIRKPLAEPSDDAVEGAQKTAWSRGGYSPSVLTSRTRTLLVIFVLGLVVGLGLALQQSRKHTGLFNINDDSYWPLLSQSVPVMAMLLVSSYSNSCDAAMRGLSVLSALSDRPRSASELDVSLLDMLGIRVLRYSGLRTPALSLTQLLNLLCGFLPVISSVVLGPRSVPKIVEITMPEQSWFGTRRLSESNYKEATHNRETLNLLSLLRAVSNFTSPRYTYMDLVFPTFHISDPDWGPGASARVKVPAAKLTPSCERLVDEDFRIIKPEHDPDNGPAIRFSQDFDCPSGEHGTTSLELNPDRLVNADGTDLPYEEKESEYIGTAIPSILNPMVRYVGCNDSRAATLYSISNASWFAQTYI